VARTYLLSGEPELLINVVDAANLERNLYLTSQLMEMRLPLVLALNMIDMARDRGVRIDPTVLSHHLGCPVIPMVASRGQGVDELKTTVARAAMERHAPATMVHYHPVIEDAIHDLGIRLTREKRRDKPVRCRE
jgi:ferrous iron transport protein B